MSSARANWPNGRSEMAARIRDHDWASTPLGPITSWPLHLKVIVDTLVSAPHAMMLGWGADLTMLYNDAYAPCLGGRHPFVLGLPLPEAWPDVWPQISPMTERVFAGEHVEFEDMLLLSTRKGYSEDTWWTFSLSPVWDDAHTVAGVLNMTVETSVQVLARREQDKAQAILRESEVRHRLLVGSWAQAVWETDPNGIVVTDSPSWRAYTGQCLEEWLDCEWLNAVHPDDRTYAERQWQEAIASHGIVDAEFRLSAPNQLWRWTNVRAAPVLDAAGRIEKWVGMNVDIDARKRAETLLREADERQRIDLKEQVRDRTAERQASHNLLQAAMDASTDMVQVFEAVRDETGEIADFRWVLNNHASESRYGKVCGESLLQRNPGVLQEGIFEAFRHVTETGIPNQAERHYVHEQFDGWFHQSVVKLGDGVATTTRDITEWKAAQADVSRLQDEVARGRLREMEERFRLLVESVRDYAIFTTDTDGLVTSWPLGAASVFGWSEEEILGRSADLTYVPEDLAAGQPQKERDLALREGAAPNVRWHMREDGSYIFIDGSTQRLTGMDGEVREFIKIGQDVTEARRVQQALTDSEARLRTLMEGMPQLVWRSADKGQWTWSSPQWRKFTGLTMAASIGLGWLDAIHPDDHAIAVDAWSKASSTILMDVEYRVRRAKDGKYIWHHTRAVPVRDGDRVIEWLGTSTDVDDLRRLQQRQQLLVAELQHRVRNVLTIVRSVFQRTVEADGPLDQMIDHFRGRLDNLARTQVIVTQNASGHVDLRSLIVDELMGVSAEEGPSITLDGPNVSLDSQTAESISLAIHELTINAVKYGALKVAGAELSVQWSINSNHVEERWLDLMWIEQGVPAIPIKPARHGFGSELIEEALPYRLGGQTKLEFRGGGVRCTITVPLPDVPASADALEDR